MYFRRRSKAVPKLYDNLSEFLVLSNSPLLRAAHAASVEIIVD